MGQEPGNDILRAWRGSAPYWEKHRAAIEMMFEPVTRALMAEAGIAAGQSVLDVAGGTGEPALTIAKVVGPNGSVTCTDAVAEMVAAARREANRRGLSNILFRRCVADSLPFDNGSFDATVSRLGAMFFPEPRAALREMLRVTRPGGLISLAVWHGKEFNPFFRIVTEIMSRYVKTSAEDPNAPGAFRFAGRGVLSGLLQDAGAADVSERIFSFHITAPIPPEDFWPLRVEMSDTLRGKVGGLFHDQLLLARREVEEATREFFTDNGMDFPAEVLVVTGKKPASVI